jgi:excinuclease ABC subunit A
LLLSNGGGEIVAVGTPEDVAKEKRSYIGHYLKDVLKRPRKEAAE